MAGRNETIPGRAGALGREVKSAVPERALVLESRLAPLARSVLRGISTSWYKRGRFYVGNPT